MSKQKLHKLTLQYLAKNISIVIGLVLVWRGIWYVLDGLDKWIFGGSHMDGPRRYYDWLVYFVPTR